MHRQEVDERGSCRGRGRQVAVGLDKGPSVSLQFGEADVAMEGEGAIVVGKDERRAWVWGGAEGWG